MSIHVYGSSSGEHDQCNMSASDSLCGIFYGGPVSMLSHCQCKSVIYG